MPPSWYLIVSFALIGSFVVAILLTALMRVVALRLGVVDRPGIRKMHSEPVPLLGGVAIYLTFNIVILSNLGLLMLSTELDFAWIEENILSFLGEATLRPLFGIFAGAFIIFLIGIVYYVKALSPEFHSTV